MPGEQIVFVDSSIISFIFNKLKNHYYLCSCKPNCGFIIFYVNHSVN